MTVWPAPNGAYRIPTPRMPRCFCPTDLEQPGTYIEWQAQTKAEHTYVLGQLMAYRSGSGIDMKISACGDMIKVHRPERDEWAAWYAREDRLPYA
jgi:hypothetical protein